MAQSPVLSALFRRRAELSGEIAKLRHRLDALRMDLQAVDHCLVMWGHASPETIRRHMLVVLGGLRSLRKRGVIPDGADGWRMSRLIE